MSSTELTATDTCVEPYFEWSPITYAQYVTINDAIGDRPSPRMIYADGRLELLTPSRSHDWHVTLIDHLVAQVATGCDAHWEPSSQTTYRHPARDAGAEGDRAYYFGRSAQKMAGVLEVDLDSQPPPDLVIEVEHTRSSKHALRAWGKLGVGELWVYNVRKHTTTFLRRRRNASYSRIKASIVLPALRPSDVDHQIRLAESLTDFSRWYAQLPGWVRETLLPRLNDPT